MILLVGMYREPNAARRAELADCLRRNLANPHIAEVHVFLEDGVDPHDEPALADRKVRPVPLGRRLRYADLFAHAARAAAGRTVIAANADIYFDGSLARLAGHDLRGKLLCLSRWDVRADGSAALFEHGYSQDAWIFEAPLPPFPCDWPLGLPGCENRLAHEATAAGLTLENPARSIRAHHLHGSGVRHYNESQRVRGPGQGIDATWLGTPWLWPIVETGAAARNRAAARADGDAILCFLDDGVTVDAGFAEAVLARREPDSFLVPDENEPGLDAALLCDHAAFDRAGGFDESYATGAAATADLRATLARLGLQERTFPASWLHCRTREPTTEGTFDAGMDAAYRRLKDALVAEIGPGVARSTLRELRRALAHHHLARSGRVEGAPCATVAFHEAMGYTVSRLAPGISSHNNDPRPFVEIPRSLDGLAFTQVVASRVSAVHIEFRTAGKLYLLVGTDWDGYTTATAFLRERGYREALPRVRTRRGTEFEVWSLLGEPGDAVELPTQVMLVARELVAA